MNDFQAEPPELKASMLAACQRVINSGWYILGPEVAALENTWAQFCGAKYAVGVGNGMDSIEIGLRALGIGPGDEVITTSMTAIASVLAIIRCGATPVLADINTETAQLSIDSAERCLTKHTRAVLLVHLYGQMSDLDVWTEFCARKSIQLIEDCAQSHGAKWHGKSSGTFGIFGAFSFYPTKNLGALGDAGLLITNDPNVAERARRLRNYGQRDRYVHSDIGLNSRLDELQAAVLLERFKWLSIFTERRRMIAARYRAEITNPYVEHLRVADDSEAHCHHLFVIRSSRRATLAQYLRTFGIETLIHYPVPIHQQEIGTRIVRDSAGLSNSEIHAQTCLSIPCHPQLTDAMVDKIISAVNSFI